MSNESGQLTPGQEKFVAQMVIYGNVNEAAIACSISPRTGQRYLSLPHVRAQFEQAKQEAYRNAVMERFQAVKKQLLKTMGKDQDDREAFARLESVQFVLGHPDLWIQFIKECGLSADTLPLFTDEELMTVCSVLFQVVNRIMKLKED